MSGEAGPAGAKASAGAIARAAVEALLVVALGLIAARAIWFVAYGSSAADLDIDPPAFARAEAGATAGAADIARLVEDGLFGAREIDGGTDDAVIDAPETRLDLILHGVRRSAEADRSSAVIQAPQRGQRSLRVGEEIVEGVTLEAVYADRVIINRRGARESLFLRDEADRPRLVRPAGAAPAPAETPAAAPAAEAAPLDRITAEDWAEGLELVRAEGPGGEAGLRIAAGSDPALLAAAGLQPGDLILAVNGRSLDRPDAALAILDDLDRASRAAFTVVREGRTVTLEADLP